MAPAQQQKVAAPPKPGVPRSTVIKPARTAVPLKKAAEPKKVVAKVETKKEEEKVEQPKEEEKKVEVVPVVVEEAKVEEKVELPPEPVVGESMIKFNHYKKMFKHTDGVIPWDDIEEQYAFSYGYVGNYKLKLRKEKEKDIFLKCEDKKFYGLEVGTVYMIEIENDEEAESKVEKKTYKALAPVNNTKTTAKDLLTNELKNMSADELREAGDKYKEILEARELEDVLFS